MSVYVDELVVWYHAKHRCFKEGSCHLTADSEEELHAFAKKIGLRREWFQARSTAPHYDLSPGRRKAALLAGAVFVSAREQAVKRLKARGLLKGG